MRYVSKHSGQNFIFFVFLYFAMLCAMFQNIAVKVNFLCFSLFRFALRYAYISKHGGQVFSFVFLCYVLVLCFET